MLGKVSNPQSRFALFLTMSVGAGVLMISLISFQIALNKQSQLRFYPKYDFNSDGYADVLLFNGMQPGNATTNANVLVNDPELGMFVKATDERGVLNVPVTRVAGLKEGYLFADKVDNYFIYIFKGSKARLVESGKFGYERDIETFEKLL